MLLGLYVCLIRSDSYEEIATKVKRNLSCASMSLTNLCDVILVELQKQDVPNEMNDRTLRKIVMAPYQLDIDSSKKKRRKSFAEAIETLQRNGSISQRVDDGCDMICLVQKEKRNQKKRKRNSEETASSSIDCGDISTQGSSQTSASIQQTLQQQIIDILSEKQPMARKKLRKEVVKSVDLSEIIFASLTIGRKDLKKTFNVAFDNMVDEGVVDDEDGLVCLVGFEQSHWMVHEPSMYIKQDPVACSADDVPTVIVLTSGTPRKIRVVAGEGVHSKAQSTWTDEMDNCLRQAHTKFGGSNWAAIAEDIQCGKSAKQCQIRWNTYAHPALDSCRSGLWTEEEEASLLQLVKIQRENAGDVPYKVNWIDIGKQLNRKPRICVQKHQLIMDLSLRQGHFSPEEDMLIKRRVEEWGDRGRGLWSSLEIEMGRPMKRIMVRYKSIRDYPAPKSSSTEMGDILDGSSDDDDAKPVLHIHNQRRFKANSYWTSEMDEKLTEAQSICGYNWSKVAEHVGCDRSPSQCSQRWYSSVDPALHRFVKKGPWGAQEVLLEQLVQASTESRVSWKSIATELGRNRLDCHEQYKALLGSRMVRGRYSAKEDAIIRQRVKEWGIKRGLWASLGRELNRRTLSVRERWMFVLCQKP